MGKWDGLAKRQAAAKKQKKALNQVIASDPILSTKDIACQKTLETLAADNSSPAGIIVVVRDA